MVKRLPLFLLLAVVGCGAPTPDHVSGVASKVGVQLTWDQSTDPAVVGYNVFRIVGKTTTELTNKPVTTPSYLDKKVSTGFYQYFVEALDAAGHPSPPSEIATVEVP